MNRLYLILLIISLFSCNGKENIPEDVLPPKKMQEVLWDYLRADSYCSHVLKSDSAVNDTTKNMIFQNVIFKHHRITDKDFTKSYNFYISHPDLMMPILDSIVSQKSKSDFGNLLKDRIRILEK
jgi:hypothetical protein